MKPIYINSNVRSHCPDCDGAITTFESKKGGSLYGNIIIKERHKFEDNEYDQVIYQLMRCAGCGRAGLAKIHYYSSLGSSELESFYPYSVDHLNLPDGVPGEINKEFREAELCASFGALRASSALFRSTLEKTLKANGYTSGSLKDKINQAAKDGVITEASGDQIN